MFIVLNKEKITTYIILLSSICLVVMFSMLVNKKAENEMIQTAIRRNFLENDEAKLQNLEKN